MADKKFPKAPMNPKTGSISKQAITNVTLSPAYFFTPGATGDAWTLPKTRQEAIKWIRIYFALEPYFQRSVMILSQFPFSKFDLVCSDPMIKRFFEIMCNTRKFNLLRHIIKGSISWYKFGESISFLNFGYGEIQEFMPGREFHYVESAVLLEPDTVEIEVKPWESEPSFFLVLTPEMRTYIKKNKNRPEIPELLIVAAERNVPVPLSSENVSIIARITDPSAVRGTPIAQSLFKSLILSDWIYLAMTSNAKRYYMPLEIWTIGDTSNDLLPDNITLDNWREFINKQISTPPFSVVVPPILKYESHGWEGKVPNYTPIMEFVHERILIGMGLTKSLLTGEGPSFTQPKTIGLQILISEAQARRDEWEDWVYQHVFKPVAQKNKWYTIEKGVRTLIYPEISWYKSLDIEGEQAEREELEKLHSKGYVSTKTLFAKYRTLRYETEAHNLQEEKGTVFDKGDRIPAEFKTFEPQRPPGSVITVPESVPGLAPIGEIPTGPEMEFPEKMEVPVGPEATPAERTETMGVVPEERPLPAPPVETPVR